MSIYRKHIHRSSYITVAIEADSEKEAQAIFDDWMEDEQNSDNVKQCLAEREKDNESWLATFSTGEKYKNFSDITGFDDFLILRPDDSMLEAPKEPLYDLYFCFLDDKNHKRYKIWNDFTMKDIVNKIQVYNDAYIFKPLPKIHPDILLESTKLGTTPIAYTLTKRK
jgi:hypothetical protein